MNVVEKSTEQPVLDLSVLEKQNKKELNDLDHEDQKVFFSNGNKKTKLQILTNFYVQQYML